MQSAVHWLATQLVARHFSLAARHVLHVAVATHAALLSQSNARRTVAIVTAVRHSFVAAGLRLSARASADWWRGTTSYRGLEHRFAACTSDIVEDSFETSLTAAFVAVCLASMHTAVEFLVANELANMNAIGIVGVAHGRATALRALVTATGS